MRVTVKLDVERADGKALRKGTDLVEGVRQLLWEDIENISIYAGEDEDIEVTVAVKEME